MRATKHCEQCGKRYARNPQYSSRQWAKSRFCAPRCAKAARVTHGQSNTRLYRVWAGIKKRCLNPRAAHVFKDYGARGITIWPGWRNDFAAFAAHVGPHPGGDFQLGRKNNNRGYEPGNVRWETPTENARNRRRTVWVTHAGRRMCLAEACQRTGIVYATAWSRIRDGMRPELAVRP